MKPSPVDPIPLLICVDIQREYETPGRPYYLNGIEAPLENCRRILAHGRARRWPIVHVRHVQDSHLFNEKLPYARFIEGFEPLAHEMVFTKQLYSCFSSPAFAEFMETTRHHDVYVVGFEAAVCCLSTLVDAVHRDMRLKFVADASLARGTGLGDEQESHRWLCEFLSVYADVIDTATALAKTGATPTVDKTSQAGRMVRAT